MYRIQIHEIGNQYKKTIVKSTLIKNKKITIEKTNRVHYYASTPLKKSEKNSSSGLIA